VCYYSRGCYYGRGCYDLIPTPKNAIEECQMLNMRQVQPETLPKNSNLPVYKISSLKITPPKTPNSGQFSYPLPNIVSFLFEKID
jgi:hypothetical protein